MNVNAREIEFLDLGPKDNSLLKEVLTGLSKSQKMIHPKFLYDKKGSEIFERICCVRDYYPTRTEKNILSSHAKEMAALIGPRALIIEPGAGAGEKVRSLLPELEAPVGYVPVEISREILLRMTAELHEEFPSLPVVPVCADFTQDFEFPLTVGQASADKKVIFFPGSTIGNLAPEEAVSFLKKCSRMVGPGGGLLIGVDVKKEKEIFEKAYDDSEGITAEFNLNLLARLNREADATFNLDNFKHKAVYNEELGRVEMHLVSLASQLVKVNQTIFRFREGESIHTESSYKYSTAEFSELAAKARFELKQCWMDEEKLFCVYYFEREDV